MGGQYGKEIHTIIFIQCKSRLINVVVLINLSMLSSSSRNSHLAATCKICPSPIKNMIEADQQEERVTNHRPHVSV